MLYDYLIIGGGIAGVTAAETIRSRDPKGTILIAGEEKHPPYSRVLLPHMVCGKIGEEKVFLKPSVRYEEKKIGFMSGAAAASVDATAREVTFAGGERIGYGKLLIATGGKPRRLSCPGAEATLGFQTLDDARVLAASMSSSPALVYGGGFIALEFIMSFAHAGVRVTSATRGAGFFSRSLDEAGRRRIEDVLKKRGVELKNGNEIKGVETVGPRKVAHFVGGASFACSAVAVGIGIVPNVGFLSGSGIGISDGVLADGRLRATAPDVFAAGDVAEYEDPLAGRRRVVGNWQNALFQGRLAGENMTGGDGEFDALTSYSISCFDLPIAFMGATDVADDAVSRETADSSLRLFLSGGRVVGAACVGPFPERRSVSALIAGRKTLTPSMRAAAADPRADLGSLID